jgi:hypothetical protein
VRRLFVGCVALGIGGLPAAARAGSPERWAAWTASPVALDPGALAPLEREALARCGTGEVGLRDTARAILARKLRGEPMPALDAIAAALRQAGEPHPWPRAWAATGRELGPSVMARLDSWIASGHDDPRLRRCGVAAGVAADGRRALVVVAVDALADLAPLPVFARTGQWLTVEATMRVPAGGARVVVLGPSGAPLTLLASFDGRTLRARFAPDRRGELALQVIADVGGGPRPVLEATVFADVAPPAHQDPRPAPGEEAGGAGGCDDDRLARMVSAARAWAGLPPLARDPRLDAVAREHARRMAHARRLAHDVGDGDPVERLRATGLSADDVGENVAHAATLALAHRAIWASPSHRANLLRNDFDRLGIAVVRDERGDAWVVETFAGRLP